ncbi:MAG: PhzF family phenazine biosynthesis protein [Holosporales bacterium]|jgi:PhzF family phenazine biosynthesis protein|nr:PhzF family phenazine biosynthesis protein [Holosporales bacterium]
MLFLIDAFTDKPFRGNPSGVFTVEDFPNSLEMQKFARYYSFPNFAFLKKVSERSFEIRWFSPRDESPMCIHGTIAAAHVIFEQKLSIYDNLKISNGLKEFKIDRGINKISISLLIPEIRISSDLLDLDLLLHAKTCQMLLEDDFCYIIILEKSEDIFNLVPNFEKIKLLEKRAIIVTAPGSKKFDFYTRYFAPKIGVYEDPFCGSANCKIAKFWAKTLNKKLLKVCQASARSGVAELLVSNDFVTITGKTHTVCVYR